MSVVTAVRSSHVPAEHFSSSSETDRVRPSSRSVQSSHARFVGLCDMCLEAERRVGRCPFRKHRGSRNTQKTRQDRFKNRRRPAPDRAKRTTRKETHGRVSGSRPTARPRGIGSSMTQRTRPVPVWSGVFPRSFSADVDAELCSVEEVLVAVLIVHDPRLGLLLARCLAAWDSSRDPRHSALASHWVLA